MGRTNKKRGDRYADPREVLDGRVEIGPFELVRLIHRVSPTAERLDPGERARRYELKAGLQSLLIRNFGESLVVKRSDPSNPDLVSIELRNFEDDACHALLGQLDEDARSWAQWHLDTVAGKLQRRPPPRPLPSNKESAAAEPSAPEGGATAEELLRSGRRALEEYDYAACEDHFSRAFSLSGGTPEAASALLEFLVDHLAAYERALSLEPALSKAARRDEGVGALLALASVHARRPQEALERIRRLTHPRVAGVCLAGARRCLQAGDAEGAADFLSLLRSRESAGLQQQIRDLEEELSRVRARALEPVEAEMSRLWEQGEREKACKLARRLLSERPDHRAARRLLEEAQRRELEAETQRLLFEGDLAGARAEYAKEAALLRKALRLSPERADLAERASRAEKAAERQRAEAEIERVVRLWTSGDERAALLGFAGLAAEERRAVADRCETRLFSWLHRLVSSSSPVKPEKAVEAVLALHQAEEALRLGRDLGEATDALKAHERLLRPVPLAAELLRRAQELSREAERARARDLLRQAQRFLADGSVQAARQYIEQVRVGLLGPEEGDLAEALRKELSRIERVRMLEGRYGLEAERGSLFGARELARELARIDRDAAPAWIERAEEHAARIRRDWRLASFCLTDLPETYALAGQVLTALEDACALLPDGRRVVFATGHGSWLFLRIFDLGSQSFTQGALLRELGPLGIPALTLRGDEVWLVTGNATVLALSLDPLEITYRQEFAGLLEEDGILERAYVFPRSRHLWLETRSRKRNDAIDICVVNMDQRRVHRRLQRPTWLPARFPCGDAFQLAHRRPDAKDIQIYSEDGRLLKTLVTETEGALGAAAIHPDGSEYVLLPYDDRGAFADDTMDEGDFVLTLEVKPDAAGRYRPLPLEGSQGECIHGLATSREERLVFVHWMQGEASEEPCHLAAFRPGESGFEEVYRERLRGVPLFAPDESSQRVAALYFGGPEVRAVRLGPEKPGFAGEPAGSGPRYSLPDFRQSTGCGTAPSERARRNALLARIAGSTSAELADEVDRIRRREAKDPEEVLAWALALEYASRPELAHEVRKAMSYGYRGHPRIALEIASEAVKRQDWGEVMDLLGDLPLDGLDEEPARHAYHLLGMAAFARGEINRASRAWEAGLAFQEGTCDLAPFVEYARLASLSPREREEESKTSGAARTLSLLERADAHLARQDWAAATELMEREDALSSRDRQVLARFAEAFLERDLSAPDPRWFGKILVLAEFTEQQARAFATSILPPFLETWSEARLNEVRERAARWLEEET